MDAVFDWCVSLLYYLAGVLGITYKEINVWIFVILWPVLSLFMFVQIVVQGARINKLRKDIKALKAKG
mgnify:CR=1 FL=1